MLPRSYSGPLRAPWGEGTIARAALQSGPTNIAEPIPTLARVARAAHRKLTWLIYLMHGEKAHAPHGPIGSALPVVTTKFVFREGLRGIKRRRHQAERSALAESERNDLRPVEPAPGGQSLPLM